MREVSDCDLPLLVDIGEEGTAIVDAEVEDAVLVGGLESDSEDCCVSRLRDGGEIEAVKGREHAEFELNLVVRRENERGEVVI